jgi:hypothetical protein
LRTFAGAALVDTPLDKPVPPRRTLRWLLATALLSLLLIATPHASFGQETREHDLADLDENVTLFSDQERWSVLVDTFGKARSEAGSDISEALTWGGSPAAGYKLGRRLEIAAGGSIGTRLVGPTAAYRPWI